MRIRGTVAFERGPLVYCIESADLPAGVALESVRVDPDVEPRTVDRSDLAPSLVGLATMARSIDLDGAPDQPIELAAIPYFAWANRGADAMRVWIPVRTESSDRRQ